MKCTNHFEILFSETWKDLIPFHFREDLEEQREAILKERLDVFQESVYQLRAILDTGSIAVCCQRLGQIVPLLRENQPELWYLSKLKATLPMLFERLYLPSEIATMDPLLRIFWGMSRFGPNVLNFDTKSKIKRMETLFLEENAFNGNEACNMMEAMFNLHSDITQNVLDVVLRDAAHDLSQKQTSPFNIVYFLRTLAKGQISVPKDILLASLQNLELHFNHLTMHHISMTLSSLAVLEPIDLSYFLHLLRQRMSFGTWLSQSMWNNDLLKLSQGLSQLSIDTVEILPIFAKLDILVRERSPSFDAKQIQEFRQSCSTVGYQPVTPIHPTGVLHMFRK